MKCNAYDCFGKRIYLLIDADKTCLVSRAIDEDCVRLIAEADEISCNILSSNLFNDIYKAYCERDNQAFDRCIDTYLCERSIINQDNNQDNKHSFRKRVTLWLPKFKAFVDAVSKEKTAIRPIYVGYRCGNRFKDKDYEDKFYLALQVIDDCKNRLLNEVSGAPDDPYNLLAGKTDNDGLVAIKHGNRRGEWLSIGENCGVLPQWSSCDLRDKFFKLIDDLNCHDINIAIRPVSARPLTEVSDFEIAMEALVYGGIFSPSLLDEASECDNGRYKYSDKSIYNVIGLIPMLWLDRQIKKMKNGDVSLMIEEVIDYKNLRPSEFRDYLFVLNGRICVRNRLIHGIYNQQTKKFTHLDLDYLYYDLQSMERRIEFETHIKDVKAVERKAFRLDGVMQYNMACNIIAAALDASHDPEVQNLLAGRIMSDEERMAFGI